MKILMLSNSEWDDNNSFGNTFSNFFADCNDIEFANIYCREGIPNTKLCDRFLKITDKQLLRYILNKNYNPVQVVHNNMASQEKDGTASKNPSRLFDFIRKKRWSIFFLAREVLWSIRDYKTIEFKHFIEEFEPDILFVPTYPYTYINKMALDIKKVYNLPIISYMSDDEYSLKQFSLSPLYWLRRIIQRTWVVRVLRNSKQVYVISEAQKRDCKKDLGIECKILTKSYDFTEKSRNKEQTTKKISLLYAGNLGTGRWKSLSYICDAVEKLCKEQVDIEFNIYSATPLTKTMNKRLNRDGCSKVHSVVPYSEIWELQKEADIVIHAESLFFRNSLAVRQSFSTKLVDFFLQSKCIFAIGRNNVASIEHLKSHDAAMVVHRKKDVYAKLRELVTESSVRTYYSTKAYECGSKCHDRRKMQQMLMGDLKRIVYQKGE